MTSRRALAVSDYFDCQQFDLGYRVLASRAVTHDSWPFDGVGNPPTVVLMIRLDR